MNEEIPVVDSLLYSYYLGSKNRGVPAKKYSASMDDELLDDVGLAAEAAGVTVSAWMAQAARDRLDILGLQQLVAEWEAEHGAFTQEQLDAADREIDEAFAENDRHRLETAQSKREQADLAKSKTRASGLPRPAKPSAGRPKPSAERKRKSA